MNLRCLDLLALLLLTWRNVFIVKIQLDEYFW